MTSMNVQTTPRAVGYGDAEALAVRATTLGAILVESIGVRHDRTDTARIIGAIQSRRPDLVILLRYPRNFHHVIRIADAAEAVGAVLHGPDGPLAESGYIDHVRSILGGQRNGGITGVHPRD